MKTVGYLEGTDPSYLTKLVVKGIETLPLGNGADNHGKYVGILSRSDDIAVVIGYLHKVVPAGKQGIAPRDLAYICKLNDIPVFLVEIGRAHV